MKAHLSKNKAVINHIATFANVQCKKGNVFINVTPGCCNYFQSTVLFYW